MDHKTSQIGPSFSVDAEVSIGVCKIIDTCCKMETKQTSNAKKMRSVDAAHAAQGGAPSESLAKVQAADEKIREREEKLEAQIVIQTLL